MNIINIIIKDLKQSLRNKKELALMILLPIVLMIILGSALSGSMDSNNVKLNDIKVMYTIQGKSGTVSEGFKDLKTELKDYNIHFYETKDVNQSKEKLKNADYACYVTINEENKTMKLLKNDRYDLDAGFVEGILHTFVQRYNVISEIAKNNPQMIGEVQKNSSTKYVKIQSLNEKKEPRAIDYYGVTMITLIILYSSMTSAFGMLGEKSRRTHGRMLVAPISRREIFIGKTMAAVLITLFEFIIVILFSKYVLNVNWGDNIGAIILLIISEIIMAVSIGIGVAFIVKKETAVSGVLNFIIPVMAFFGGAYVPLEQMNSGIIDAIARFSPIKWINNSILDIIFRNSYDKISTTLLINLSIAFILLIIASTLFRKEEA